MSTQYDLTTLDEKIKTLRKTAEEIDLLGDGIEAVKRNVVRILASTKMLEINICDVREILG
jgi:hypothetical protein